MSHYIDSLLRDFPELSVDNKILPLYYRMVSLGKDRTLYIYKVSRCRITCKIVCFDGEGELKISILLKDVYTPITWSFNRRIQFIKNHLFSEALHGYGQSGVRL